MSWELSLKHKIKTPADVETYATLLKSAYDDGDSIGVASKKIGTTPNTVYRWARKHPLIKSVTDMYAERSKRKSIYIKKV